MHSHADVRATADSGHTLRHVTNVDPDSARQRFGDVLALYDFRAGDAKSLVAAATDLLVEDTDGEGVVALASKVVTPLTSPFEMDDLVTEARDELRMSRLDPDQTAIRAAQAQVRRWRSGELTDRDLTAWAHQAIGHQGPAVLQDLVVSDDLLDEVGITHATNESIHEDLETIADQLLACTDPWGR
jgi:hypothetical protein